MFLKNRDRGSSSIVVLAVVMFLSTVFLAMVFFIQTSLVAEMKHKKATELRQVFIEEAQEVIKLLQKDLDKRENDNPFDDVWSYVNSNENIELKDVGSYLNPNWIDPQVFEHIDKTLLPPPNRIMKSTVPGAGWQELVQYWYDEGIHLNIKEAYKDFFEEEVIEEFMTPYSYFNINLCFQHVLKKFCLIRTGSERDADDFQKTIDAKLLKGKVILDQYGVNGIERWFLKTSGVDLMSFKKMYPVLNAVPVLNVHFVPEEILRSLLSYKPFGVRNPDIVADSIIARREDEKNKKGLTTNDLKTIIGSVSKYPGPRIFHYLGVYTNFWEIRVTIEDMELRWVIARVPPLKETDDIYYKLIEENIGRIKEEESLEPEFEESDEPEIIDESEIIIDESGEDD
ncbi:MAG: hypothetical protein JXB88_14145 [Spirochaetales bacterium]|nr:hypothetical protein [Spirochaetales bacterium]